MTRLYKFPRRRRRRCRRNMADAARRLNDAGCSEADPVKAHALFTSAIALNPGLFEAFANRASVQVLARDKEFDLTRALELNPAWHEVRELVTARSPGAGPAS